MKRIKIATQHKIKRRLYKNAHTILITGANRGLGLEFVKKYTQADWQVIATCRSPEQAFDLQTLQKNHPLQIKVFQLDVTDSTQIKTLKAHLQKQPIDLLINNAGIFGPQGVELGKINVLDWDSVIKVNMMAPLILVQELLENVQLSDKKIIAAISSKMGSLTETTVGKRYYYRTSKCGLNMIYKCLAIDLADKNIICILLNPGWVKTRIGGIEAPLSATESVKAMGTVLEKITMSDSGTFFNYDGKVIPW